MNAMDTHQDRLWQHEARRRDMLLRADVAGLAALLLPELCYVHTNGEVDRQDDVLRKLLGGQLRYLRIEDDAVAVDVLPHAGIVHTTTWLDVEVQGVHKRMHCLTTGVWMPAPEGWRLAYYRSRKTTPPATTGVA